MIKLIPVGDVDGGLLDWLSEKLPARSGQLSEVLPPIHPPKESYNPTRRQYVAGELLDALSRVRDAQASRVVGIIDADTYADDLNFIFGLAAVSGRNALVALPRLRQSYYGLAPDVPLFRERVLKEVIHELGHTWGLRHCPDAGCVMHFSNSLKDTDRKGGDFCSACAQALLRCEG